MTTRRWMAVVAALALVLGAIAGMWRRARRFERLATSHALDAVTYADAAWDCVRFNLNRDGDVDSATRGMADRYWELYVYHGLLEEKYDRAASRPWLPVEPDPPEPKRIAWGGSGDL
jgi:hypothetical protein